MNHHFLFYLHATFPRSSLTGVTCAGSGRMRGPWVGLKGGFYFIEEVVHFTSSTIPLKTGFVITISTDLPPAPFPWRMPGSLSPNSPPTSLPSSGLTWNSEYCGYFNHKIKWIGLKKIVITVNENWDSWKPGFEETTVSQYILLDLMVWQLEKWDVWTWFSQIKTNTKC